VDEKWKSIRNTNYEISDYGRVKNSVTGFILKQAIDRYGYPKIHICDLNKKPMYKTIHRLVAEEWIENKDPNLQVNHKDGNKLNNTVTNLEWCTGRENIIHSLDNLLNTNTIPAKLIDLESNTVTAFRSIKDIGRHLEIYMSVLMPLIKNSENNPIFGKYAISINNEDLMELTTNASCFGKPIYVYDCALNVINKYVSILAASYFTGIRCLGNINKFAENNVFYKIGYYISFNVDLIDRRTSSDKERILKERIEYLNTPYKKRPDKYYLYDYYKKEEYEFESIDDIAVFLNTADNIDRNVSNSIVSLALYRNSKKNVSGLIKGFGIKSDKDEIPWYPYAEEAILSSILNKPFCCKGFRVNIGEGNEKVIFGINNLCKYLDYRSDKLFRDITIEEILESSDIPNLSIKRLNSPIE
jgi:hypothetical protein